MQNQQHSLKVQCEICSQDGLFQQLHEVSIIPGWQIGEYIMALEKSKDLWLQSWKYQGT